MIKIKQWGRSLMTFGSRYKLLLVIILSLLIIVFSVFYGILYGKLWLKFPSKVKAEIALNRLGVSSYNNPVCHEACFYERKLYKQIIADNWDNDKIKNRVKELILAEDNNLIFRLELLDSLSLKNNFPLPDYLQEYLVSGQELKVKDKIRAIFAVDNYSVEELLNNFSSSSSAAVQIDTLASLQAKSDSSLADFYLDLIVNNSDLKIANGALSALSNLVPSENYVTSEFLLKIKNLIFSPMVNQYLRKEAVLLLGEYLSVQEKPATEILTEACLNETVIDKFSRLFACDTLNRLSANNYAKPEISASEWQEYRDHNSLWGND